jgi:uncharacterized protein (TIGR02271 family)
MRNAQMQESELTSATNTAKGSKMSQQETSRVRLDEMHGSPVYDNAGEHIGKVEEIFYDEQSNRPEWVGIGTGFFGTKRVLVPVDAARISGDGLVVAYSKEQVKDSPDVDEDEITSSRETELRQYYGLAGGRGATTDEASQSITRSEEEIEVGKRQVDAGSARLRKWVDTEPVALDIELRHEVARVTREQINEPVADHDFQEQEVEVPLHAEKAVVQKQAVAKERIGLEKDVQTETKTVRDEVRKERVDVEGDVKKGKAR